MEEEVTIDATSKQRVGDEIHRVSSIICKRNTEKENKV